MRLALDHPGTFASPLDKFDPRWKIVSVLILAAAVAVLHDLVAILVACIAAMLLALWARIPRRWFARRLASVSILLALFLVWLPFLEPGPVWTIGPLAISRTGVALAGILLFKAWTLVALFLTLWATASPGSTLKAAQMLYIPGIVLHLFALTYRYFHLFAEELGRIRMALRVRGFRNRATVHSYRVVGNVAGILLLRSYERAERLGQAMRCRGFDGKYRSLFPLRTQVRDVCGVMVSMLVGGALVSWDFLR